MAAAAQLTALNRALLARTQPVPVTEEFFSTPSHRMARIARDMLADDAVATTMEVRDALHSAPRTLNLEAASAQCCKRPPSITCKHASSQALHAWPCVRANFPEGAAVSACVQNPLQAVMTHTDYGMLYFDDPASSSLGQKPLSRLVDIICENQGLAGIHVAEIGAGTGGLTRQVRAMSSFGLDHSVLEPLQFPCGTEPDSVGVL